jgi:hypothetical protein
MKQMEAIGADLAEAFQKGVEPHSPVLTPILTRHNEWVSSMWGRPCTPEAYAGLADLYQTTPEFVERFEGVAPGFTKFLVAAMKAWSAGR